MITTMMMMKIGRVNLRYVEIRDSLGCGLKDGELD